MRLLKLITAGLMITQAGTKAAAADDVAGQLIQFNDNGAWCWYQDPRVVIDKTNNTMLIGSVATADGPGGAQRAGNVEVVSYDSKTGKKNRFVLHEHLAPDDHNTAAFYIRNDGRYLAVYTKHNQDKVTRWRISTNPHDISSWEPEKTFDWSKLTGPQQVTYSNLHYLSAEKRLYNCFRGINDDPTIMISSDEGQTWTYGGKLLTIPKLGYVNGYTRYVSNGVDRIDFITTEHHPRDFNNSIYHGYVKGAKLYKSDSTVVDENVLDENGHPQTELTKVFAADSVVNGDTMTRAWTADIRLDSSGNPVALITCRANDVPANSSFNDHRLFYARFDGKEWRVDPLAKMGPCLWRAEEDYTGLGAIHPFDVNTVYVSTPIDPRDGKNSGHHEIYMAVTSDSGATWKWSPITQNSTMDNLRPIVPAWDVNHTAVLWFRGSMTRSQVYDTAIVGLIESK